MRIRGLLLPVLLVQSGLMAACTKSASDTALVSQGAPAEAVARNPERVALFGDTHVHTMYSFDAYSFGTRATPDAAYRYAKGEALTHPAGFEMKLARPLDFQAVTDHGIYLGIVPAMGDPDSAVGQHPLAVQLRADRTPQERLKTFYAIIQQFRTSPKELLNADITRAAWKSTIEAAERHYHPGQFTTFIAYEFTSAPDFQNLHRNVIFRGSQAPDQPFSGLDSQNPEQLWDWMDGLRAAGIDALAIPHNSNASNGQMFKLVDWASNPLSGDYARQRMRNEPIIEITQVKGTSETHPALSPNDEWAGFEIMPMRVASPLLSEPSGGYAREALLNGLSLSQQGLGNPFKFGFIGASDTHVGAGSFDESNYWSKVGLLDASGRARGSVPTGIGEDGRREFAPVPFRTWGASGLAGVWAESNTREAIFSAMRRKETFATSGPRIRLRFFASRKYSKDLLSDASLVKTAYAKGVPMGGELAAGKAPSFLAWAIRDPDSAPLQRLQIIKGWIDTTGKPQERVIDVACADGLTVDPQTRRCPDNGATVNLADCSISSDRGAGELKALWTDPDYDRDLEAFYYVRALENPSCRWSTWDAVRAGTQPDEALPATIQERAWSSPIWSRAK